MLPLWSLGLAALVYALEYLWRASSQKDRRFLYLGKAVGRVLLAGTFFYVSWTDLPQDMRIGLIRWSVFLFLIIDLFYVALDHIMARMLHGKNNP